MMANFFQDLYLYLLDACIDAWMHAWMHGCMHGYIDACMDARMHAWMYGCMHVLRHERRPAPADPGGELNSSLRVDKAHCVIKQCIISARST